MTTPTFSHIVVVVEENHNYDEIAGNTAEAPFINSLMSGGANLTNFTGLTHPSQPNYFALYAGSTFSTADDNSYSEPDPTLYTILHGAGLTFTGFVDQGGGGSDFNHDPWVSFPEGHSVQTDFTSFPALFPGGNYSSLPSVSYVIPSVTNDMHNGTIAQGDSWLQANLAAYAQWALTNNSLLVVVWDENNDETGVPVEPNNQIPAVLYGANVVPGNYNAAYNAYNLLSTVTGAFGLTGPNNAATAAPIQVFSAAVVDTLVPVPNVHANDISRSGDVTGPYNFIDLLNLEASWSDLIQGFGTNTQAMQNWFNNHESSEQRPDTFDGLDYIASYTDLINGYQSAGSEQAVLDAGAEHFIAHGYYEGRTTSFNGLDYIASYDDLIKGYGVNGDAGAYHFIEHGASEGRRTTFDGLDYIASYSDLIKGYGANEQAGAEHFIAHGYYEGRTTTFDGLDYIAGYTDLMKGYGANNDAGATHYIEHGLNEGRSAQAFDVAAYETAHPDLIGLYGSNDAFLTAYINTYATTGKFLT